MPKEEINKEEAIALAKSTNDTETLLALLSTDDNEIKIALISNPVFKNSIVANDGIKEEIGAIKKMLEESKGGLFVDTEIPKDNSSPIWVYFPAIVVMYLITYLIENP